jgi:Zn-finger protein
MKNCEGNYVILENGIKDCSKCDIIHKKDVGYDFVIKKIIENNKK